MVKQLGSDTFKNLLDEMKMCGNFGFLMAPMVIIISLADSSGKAIMDEIVNDNQSDRFIMGNICFVSMGFFFQHRFNKSNISLEGQANILVIVARVILSTSFIGG